jgi:carboxypeptidase Taq
MTDNLTRLKARLAEVVDLQQAVALVAWDQQTYMPPGGAGARAAQLGTLQRLAHDLFVADETGRLLADAAAELAGQPDDSDDVRLVQVTQRDFDRDRKLPSAFVVELAHARALAHQDWVKAKAAADFSLFAPALERQFALARRMADYLGYSEHPYDALLDLFEPGMRASQVTTILAALRDQLTALLRRIQAGGIVIDDSLLRQPYDVTRQREFTYDVMRRFGYDFTRGRHDVAPHPFCTSFSIGDVRITSDTKPDDLAYLLFSAMHETGHALYEQGISPQLERTPLAQGTSLGVHESQSRLWENIVGRGRPAWTYFYPRLQGLFGAQLGGVSFDQFYQVINQVQPSLIRIQADELTYNLHILVRFELEMALLEGKQSVADLPQAWNDKMQAYLGIVPPNDALGVLQDVHWSDGLIGYFPTYTLGNLMGAQLFDAALVAHPNLPEEFAAGEFGTLRGWLHDHVHVHGRKFTANELLQRITGGGLDARPYVDYLTSKFCEVYQIPIA